MRFEQFHIDVDANGLVTISQDTLGGDNAIYLTSEQIEFFIAALRKLVDPTKAD